MNSCIDQILLMFERHGGAEYLGEVVSQREHALEAAYFAAQDNAKEELVVAALLHDIGHLLVQEEGLAEAGVDARHEDSGYAWLAKYFSPAIVDPVRLHVDAKRYLCATDAEYLAKLSPASKRSLALQGGPFSASEAEDFARRPYAMDAVRLRRWDDLAKIRGLAVPGFANYRELIIRHANLAA